MHVWNNAASCHAHTPHKMIKLPNRLQYAIQPRNSAMEASSIRRTARRWCSKSSLLGVQEALMACLHRLRVIIGLAGGGWRGSNGCYRDIEDTCLPACCISHRSICAVVLMEAQTSDRIAAIAARLHGCPTAAQSLHHDYRHCPRSSCALYSVVL